VLSLWHFRLARSGSFILVASGRRAARPIKQSDRPTRTCGGRRRRRFLFRLTDRGDEELELGWSWRPPLRPDGDVDFAGSGLAGAGDRLPPETLPTMVAHRNCYRNGAALTISLRFLARARGEGTRARQQSEPPMPRRATRARRIKLNKATADNRPCSALSTKSPASKGRLRVSSWIVQRLYHYAVKKPVELRLLAAL
jgi:hypothetical protein